MDEPDRRKSALAAQDYSTTSPQWDNVPVRIQRAIGIGLWFIASSVSSSVAATRHYYIAAEDVTWNYAPSGFNLLTGTPISQPWMQKLQWTKSRFVEYTDDAFTTPKPQPDWLGILGPVIRAEVGDEIVVDFLNRSRRGHDIHPHGLRYDKSNEGSLYLPVEKGGFVAPGARYTYHWFANAASGPGPGQPSSIVWWYHAHVNAAIEINAGLLGPIVVTAKGKARADGSPKDVDREFIASFMIFNEMGGNPAGQFYAINGFIFGNLPGLFMKQGDKVRWYLLGMGNEIDVHTPHWHGETVTEGGRNTDVIELLPGSMRTVDMVADNPGTWLFHCQVSDHMEAGMMAVYTIYSPPSRQCPIQFGAGDFWNLDKNFLTVKNVSGKPIKNVGLTFEHLLTPQDLRRPFDSNWPSPKPLAAGQEEVLERPAYPAASAQGLMGWVFLPYLIQYEDGTKWTPTQDDECFHVYWRDKDHPEMPALPPLQKEIKDD